MNFFIYGFFLTIISIFLGYINRLIYPKMKVSYKKYFFVVLSFMIVSVVYTLFLEVYNQDQVESKLIL